VESSRLVVWGGEDRRWQMVGRYRDIQLGGKRGEDIPYVLMLCISNYLKLSVSSTSF
jgi:hypothetical protein